MCIRDRSCAARSRWRALAPGAEAVREGTVLIFVEAPRDGRRRPGGTQLGADEAGPHAQHGIAPGDGIGAEKADEMTRGQREATAPRLAGAESSGAVASR